MDPITVIFHLKGAKYHFASKDLGSVFCFSEVSLPACKQYKELLLCPCPALGITDVRGCVQYSKIEL